MSRTLSGVGATPRRGVGTVVWVDRESEDAEDADDADDADDTDRSNDTAYHERTAESSAVDHHERASESPAAEVDRFEAATEAAVAELDVERERTAERVGESEAEVFDAHKQFLLDPTIESSVEEAIEAGKSAETAVWDAFAGPIEQFEGMDGMMAERADDLRDVRDRLLRILSGADRRDLSALADGTVVLADRLTPSDTAQLDPEAIAGVVTAKGGRTSHAAIIARSLGIPAVVGVGAGLFEVDVGVTVAVDGESGRIVIDPDAETIETYSEDTAAAAIHDAVETADGTSIEVAANLGSPTEAAPAIDAGADGVGLFRTEFLFLDRGEPPTEDEQYEAYHEVCAAFADRCAAAGGHVVVRTADIGGDKPIDYLGLDPIENGFLGARGIRLSLEEHAGLFETQLRALCRVAGSAVGEHLAVMFPLVSTVEELDAAIDRVHEIVAELNAEGVDAAVPELGVMIETPASVMLADAFADRVDFLSIGTNDLTQYVLAAQRDLDRMDDYHDPLAPAVIRAIDQTVQASGDAWVSMCGEMAGDPALTALLVGLGIDELSMSAVTIPDVKRAVRDIDRTEAEALAADVVACETRADVRSAIGLE
ncbi:phosphoenolpyruvate--protein phosphotransferase [Halalkalirubrum salinum]|uniref:phosphoenolpyruvate--protein phosphotransferase n=1 Tax=Halalkalirubrum salinum TaxID=2563889 RepID=UPI0010FBA061|nr:phosphoenolpyruvate--protein phosphotransferase [Halalkalirubrum salinum]